MLKDQKSFFFFLIPSRFKKFVVKKKKASAVNQPTLLCFFFLSKKKMSGLGLILMWVAFVAVCLTLVGSGIEYFSNKSSLDIWIIIAAIIAAIALIFLLVQAYKSNSTSKAELGVDIAQQAFSLIKKK